MLHTSVFGVANILKQRSWSSSVLPDTDNALDPHEDPKNSDVKTERRILQNKNRGLPTTHGKDYETDQTPSDLSGMADRPKIEKKFKHKSKDREKLSRVSSINDITTSDWLLVSNIPPMSQLSDLLPSLDNILKYEINKGIINLDELLTSNGTKSVDFRDPEYYHQLKEMDALDSLYSTQTIHSESSVPLCKLTLDPDQSLTSQLIVEARLHLSYRARPMGWFLRFNNRSIAHAVRCHVREAERHTRLIKEKFKDERKSVLSQRRVWIEGLWKSVRGDYAKKHSRKRHLGVKDSLKDRKLMWGEDVVTEQESDDVAARSLDEHISNEENELTDIDTAINEDRDQSRHEVDKFYDDYTEARPYPMHTTTMPSVESVFEWHNLKVGSASLRVDEFSPTSSPIKTEKKMDYWEQHSFHLASALDLSDSCVRVETTALNTKVHEIIYLLRGYDLKSIYLEAPGLKQMPSSFAHLPKSIGWNLRQCECDDKSTPQQLAVDLLVAGEDMRNFQRRNGVSGKRQDMVTPPWKHTFLIRFATPADARMAIREMQGTPINERRMIFSQYPRADLDSLNIK